MKCRLLRSAKHCKQYHNQTKQFEFLKTKHYFCFWCEVVFQCKCEEKSNDYIPYNFDKKLFKKKNKYLNSHQFKTHPPWRNQLSTSITTTWNFHYKTFLSRFICYDKTDSLQCHKCTPTSLLCSLTVYQALSRAKVMIHYIIHPFFHMVKLFSYVSANYNCSNSIISWACVFVSTASVHTAYDFTMGQAYPVLMNWHSKSGLKI